MQSKIIARGIIEAIAVLAGVTLILLLLYQIRSVIIYCVIAAIVALLCRPSVLFFRRRLQLPNVLAVLITLFGVLGIILGVIALSVPVITGHSENLSMLNMENIQGKFNEILVKVSDYFGASEKVVENIIEETDIENNVMEQIEVGFINKFFSAFVEIIGELGIGLLSVLFISFFFLKDGQLIQRSILTFVPVSHQMKTINSISKIKDLLSRYFVGLLLQMTILFIFYTAGLLIVDIENAVYIAFICALFNIIPYLGPLLGGGIMLLLVLTSNIEMDFNTVVLPKAGYVLIAIVVGQLVDNLISQPVIFSNRMKSHPLEIFLVIVIAGSLFGILGMIAAVPGYTVIKVILKEFMVDNRIVKSLTDRM